MKVGLVQSAELQQLLTKMKKSERASAIASGISIDNSGPEALALIPIGSWILGDSDLVSQMANWRGRAMAFFFHQFEASPESMAHYLDAYAVRRADQLLFLVSVDEAPVGHIGLSGVRPGKAVLDNMIRGQSGGPPSLMLEAERCLIEWAIKELVIREFSLQIQSRNFLAKRLHEEVGFEVAESFYLRRTAEGSQVRLETCSSDESTESFKMEIMALNSELWTRAKPA